jgi:hypothetical protein
LGHVVTIGAILLTMATAYTTYQITVQDHDSRLRTLEKQAHGSSAQMSSVSDALYAIKQDLAVIKYRLEHDERRSGQGSQK